MALLRGREQIKIRRREFKERSVVGHNLRGASAKRGQKGSEIDTHSAEFSQNLGFRPYVI